MWYLFYARKINTVCLRMRSSKFHFTNVECFLQHQSNTRQIFHRILFFNCFYKKNLLFVEELLLTSWD